MSSPYFLTPLMDRPRPCTRRQLLCGTPLSCCDRSNTLFRLHRRTLVAAVSLKLSHVVWVLESIDVLSSDPAFVIIHSVGIILCWGSHLTLLLYVFVWPSLRRLCAGARARTRVSVCVHACACVSTCVRAFVCMCVYLGVCV